MIDSLSKIVLPSAPLVDYVVKHHPYVRYSNGHGMQAVGVKSVLPERLERVYWRARRSGRISVGSADDICYALGIHPTEIWGQDFYEEESAWPGPRTLAAKSSAQQQRQQRGSPRGSSFASPSHRQEPR